MASGSCAGTGPESGTPENPCDHGYGCSHPSVSCHAPPPTCPPWSLSPALRSPQAPPPAVTRSQSQLLSVYCNYRENVETCQDIYFHFSLKENMVLESQNI